MFDTDPTSVGILVLLRAFASGAVALTGTEAIATGVPAFKPPESKNAATTLTVMAGVLGVLFVGITFLATNFGIMPVDGPEKQTVVAQVAAVVFGGDSIGFYLFQAFTALLLGSWPRPLAFAAFPLSPRSSPSTASSRASSPSAATAWPSRWASSPWGSSRPSWVGVCLGLASTAIDPRPHPVVRGRIGVFYRLHDRPVFDDSATGLLELLACRAGGRRLEDQRSSAASRPPDRRSSSWMTIKFVDGAPPCWLAPDPPSLWR